MAQTTKHFYRAIASWAQSLSLNGGARLQTPIALEYNTLPYFHMRTLKDQTFIFYLEDQKHRTENTNDEISRNDTIAFGNFIY